MLGMLTTLAQSDGGSGGGAFGALIWLAIIGAFVASMWKVFAKAGEPGWAAIVPIYNMYCLCRVAGRPGWWTALMFVPFVNFVMFAIVSIDVAKAFGKSAGFGVGLWLLGFVFYPILAFGSAEFRGSGEGGPTPLSGEDRAMAA